MNEMDHDMSHVVSKLMAVGMTEEQCWPRVTSMPAQVHGLGDVTGRLDAGAAADFCVVRAGDEPEVMKDGQGETRTGYRWEPIVTVLAGEVV